MSPPLRLEPGDLLELKKGHPCGANDWEVIRPGMDVKLRCRGCGHYVVLPRGRLERRIRRHQTARPDPDRSSDTHADG